MGIVDSEGALVVEYKYDAQGKPISTWTLTAEYQALAVCNPFRYRGYVYDGETGLYYLYNRYYVPLLTRFINPDIVLGVVGKVNSHNAYAYCLNTPILKYDPDGYSAAEALAFFQQAAVADGPLPFGEAIGLIGALWILLRALSDSDAHVQSNSIVREREDDRDDNPTYIYRYGSSTYYNLTPRSTDKGLSFSLVPPADGRAF